MNSERNTKKKSIAVFFLIFTLSGFSGLIYESIWTHYLKLFLGHAAYAQSLVLAIFMGGMAIGSWICSRYSGRWKNLLLNYAIAEGVIGICALFFHNTFDSFIFYSYTHIIPQLGSPSISNAYKWTVSSLFIMPQSILLGMTFPLMSAGVLRFFPENPGKTISMLYFTNSIGASAGALISGFLLVRLAGLPGTMIIAGIINILLAVIVWMMIREKAAGSFVLKTEKDVLPEAEEKEWYFFLLFASLITGAASFIYEIGWIRMLSLVLGSSTHAFELMLSAFILGLALGGLWIKRRIDSIGNPLIYLVFIQVIMGILALSTLPVYGNTFKIMQWLMKTLPKTDAGYFLFNLSGHGISMLIMLPSTFCAGMTLPLITYSLLKQGYGEKSIGAVYAFNTVGAIAGVFFAIHMGMPLFGLKGLLVFGASLDIALGIALLWSKMKLNNLRLSLGLTSAGICAIAAVLFFVHPDPFKMASGVFRLGSMLTPESHKLLYHKDGKTATISLSLNKIGFMAIRSNGKVDAAINMDKFGLAHKDESTMILAAAIPMAINPEATTAAVIGLGSGLTTNTLLKNPGLRQVDTVEIEKFMVEAAQYYRPRTESVYTDTRSKIYIEDAKTFFSAQNKKYDLIISEPSNPWVSGVSGLFSEEFYRLIGLHLAEHGLFVQWVQLYEIDTELVLSVLKALSRHFHYFSLYAANSEDLVIIARKNSPLGNISDSLFKPLTLNEELKRIYVRNIKDIEVRRTGNENLVSRLIGSSAIRANSDYYPVLDQNAARTRFLKSRATEIIDWVYEPLPAFEMLSGSGNSWGQTEITLSPLFEKTGFFSTAMALRDFYLKGDFNPKYAEIPDEIIKSAVQLKKILQNCGTSDDQDKIDAIFITAKNMIPYLKSDESDAVWKSLKSGQCKPSLSSREEQWISLFKAIGRRDAQVMAGISRTLLENGGDWDKERLKYLIVTAMLGEMAQGNREEAINIWSNYQSKVDRNSRPEILLRLLSADRN